MKYGVFGPKHVHGELFTDLQAVANALVTLKDADSIVTGGGTGVETLALEWAEKAGKPYKIIRPNTKLYGPSAFPDLAYAVAHTQMFEFRNDEILDAVDAVVVFWDSWNAHGIRIIQKAGLRKKQHAIVFFL
jgi:hypothetical protein